MFFSIIVPMYNVDKYITRCVNSIKNQTLNDFEVIFIDDGCTDGTVFLLKELIKGESQYHLIRQKNKGLSSARNKGIEHARGRYIILLDSDDVLTDKCCETIHKSLTNHKQADIVAYGFTEIKKCISTNISHTSVGYFESKEFMKNELINNNLYMVSWSYAYKKEFLKDNNLIFKEGILHEDEEFTPRALLTAKNILSIKEPLYRYYINNNSITTKKNKDKNAIDLYSTLKNLSNIYSKLDDLFLRKELENLLVEKYLFMISGDSISKNVKKDLIDRKFLIGKNKNIKNKIKAMIFIISPSLYFLVHKVCK